MADRLKSLFAKLAFGGAHLPSKGTFSVLPIGEGHKHYLGVTDDGAPCVLLHASPKYGVIAPPVRLHGIEVQFNVPCRVILSEAATRDEILTTVLSTSKDSIEREYFLYAAEILLQIVGPDPALSTLMDAVARLANIFQRLTQPQRKPLTGLLGELMIILQSASPYDAVMAWRSATDDTFDFAVSDLRLEVKATQSRQRLHHLSYAQCHPPKATVGVLASVIIEAAGGGTSLEDLLREIETLLIERHDAVMRLNETVAASLGQSMANAMGERFDRETAKQSLQLFDLNDVPAIRGVLPLGVSQVRFCADLSGVIPRPASFFTAISEAAKLLLPE